MPQYEITWIPASKLSVDPTLQRSLDHRRVARIAAEFDLEAVSVLTVSLRDDGTYHIADGMHRAAAAVLAMGEDVELPCKVHFGLGTEGEAKQFRIANNTKKPQAVDAFRIRVVEGDPTATGIDRIVRTVGWEVRASRSGEGSFLAVAAAERVFRLDPAAVGKALFTIGAAWGYGDADNRVFEGLGLLYARDGDAVNVSDMVDRLKTKSGGQKSVLMDAHFLANLKKMTVVQAVAEVLVDLYNFRRKTRGLPPWRS